MATSELAPDIVHLEQCVNDRFGTDPAPALPPDLLPESGRWQPMAWAELPIREVEILEDDPDAHITFSGILAGAPGTMRFPLHPLTASRYQGYRVVSSGRFAVSASYRTVFFEPEPGSAFYSGVPNDSIAMIKLHLDEPLPGIAGDRRLTADRVRKCIQLSAELPKQFDASRYKHPLKVLRERLGIIHGDRGAIFRFIPRKKLFPLFALYSRDTKRTEEPPLLIRAFDHQALGANDIALGFGELLAEPLLRAVFAGFDLGFSLELHAQNALGTSSPQQPVDKVYFRDLESVLYFPGLRADRTHPKLLFDTRNKEFIPNPDAPRRWFNRNVDHDVGRILNGALKMLRREGRLSEKQSAMAVRSCQQVYRRLIDEFELQRLDPYRSLLPLARGPYGGTLSAAGYYRRRFR